MKKVYRVKKDGTVIGLWADEIEGLGEAKVTRASKVEFVEEKGAWSVEFLVGPLAGSCLVETFPKRKDALSAEVSALNEQIENGTLGGERG